MKETDLTTTLKGIGPKKAEAIGTHLGIHTIHDLISFFPVNYKNRGVFTSIKDWQPGMSVLTKALYTGKSHNLYLRGLTRTTLYFESEDTKFSAVYYNQPYRKNSLTADTQYILYGNVDIKGNVVSLICPQVERLSDSFYLKEGIYPIYPIPQKSPIKQREIYKYIQTALDKVGLDDDTMPQWLKNRFNLPGRLNATKLVHMPSSAEDIRSGESYFKLREFIKFYTRLGGKAALKDKAPVLSANYVDDFLNTLSFEITNAQRRAISDIIGDVTSGNKMNRLLQGDVGSGKTAVAVCAAAIAASDGYQAALTAPTEILARQHYESYAPKLAQLGISSVLLYSSMKAKDRRDALSAVSNGSAKVIFGTHAVFSDDVIYKNLALIVIDEQHRYGVNQRAKLEHKGEKTHVLVMSATPIPRTLSLSLYKDLDISIIDEMPKGRAGIKTVLADLSKTERIYQLIKENALRGYKSYIVCPAVDAQDLENAAETYREAAKVLEPFKVACLTGQTKSDEKNKIMENFAAGDTMVLVATSVIEVGVDVASATMMWVKGSERFGLSQLHQLRGRVGRGSAASLCIFQASTITEKVAARLTVLKNTLDGFEIAKEDLKLRGAGEIFGIRQSGKTGGILEAAMEYEELFIEAEDITEKLKSSNNKEDKLFYNSLVEEEDFLSDIVMN